MTDRSAMISAIVLTHNEENNIRWCLESVVDVMPIYVVDSGSTDDTLAICNQYTRSIGHHAYHNHAAQWAWALASTPFRSRWILVLDADFVVSAALRARIEQELAGVADEVAGIYVRHCYRFAGGMIRYGGTKRYWLRLVRRGRVRPDQGDLVDFRFVVEGRTVKWRQSVLEYNRKDDDSTVWLKKQDKFAMRLAVEEELRRRGLHKWEGKPRLFGNADERFAWLRDRWLDVPLFVRPFLYFLYRYVVAGGFLDGRAGAIYHIFQGLWLRLLVDWKTVELRSLEVDDEGLEQIAGAMLTIQSGSVAEARRAIAGPRPDGTSSSRRSSMWLKISPL
jgi:glycosyltransferase involved in cell wall biosynthesis